MKKILFVLFLAVPVICFSETVFIPHIGFDIINFKNDKKFDDFMSKLVNKGLKRNKATDRISVKDIPQSNPNFAAFTFGLDMRFIMKNGFTFYWNNMFSVAEKFSANQFVNYIAGQGIGQSDKIILYKKAVKEKYYLMLFSTEFLFGATYFRTGALSLNFGLGLKFSATPLIKTIYNLKRDIFPETMSLSLITALGGTFGVSYYFNDIVGLSVSISDFMGAGIFAFERIKERDGSKIKTADIYTSLGFTNDFSVKFGVNLRINGKLEK